MCPDCRLVFRVPRDHDGRGLVCPGCRRLLRLPLAGEPTQLVAETPPLAVSRSHEHGRAASEEEENGTESGLHRRKVRRRRSAKRGNDGEGEGPAWEHGSRGAHRRGWLERLGPGWLLGGGTLLLLLVVGVMALALRGGKQDIVASGDGPDAPPEPLVAAAKPLVAAAKPEIPPDVVEVPLLMQRPEHELMAEAEPLARKFLDATTIDELLEVVVNPERARQRMQREYPDGQVEAPGMAEFNASSSAAYDGSAVTVAVRTADYASKQLTFVESDGALKIDWESWVGWCDMAWPDFLAKRPSEPQMVRVLVRKVVYYNFDFTDDVKWQSYQLETAGGKRMVYGYVERGSVLDERIRFDADVKVAPMILTVRFDKGAREGCQEVLIVDKLADGWVEPEHPVP